MKRDNLLNLDHTPTLEELREFFKANDWTSAKIYDNPDFTQEDIECIKEISDLVTSKWDKIAYEKGLKLSPYHSNKENNALVKLRNETANNIGGLATKLVNENPDELMNAVEKLFTENPELLVPENADKFFENGMNILMDTMEYDKLLELFKKMPAEEDFSNTQNNLRKIDFDRKWNHTRAKIKTESLEEINEPLIADKNYDEAQINLIKNEFWESLDNKDKQLLTLKMQGHTQSEIAEILNYKTHSAVSKRLEKLKSKFKEEYIL